MTSQQPALSASMNSMAPMSAGGHLRMTREQRRGRADAGTLPRR